VVAAGTTEELIEAANEAAARAKKAVEKLKNYSEPDLFLVLNLRVTDLEKEVGQQAFDLPIDPDRFPRGPGFQQLGKRIYLRWSQSLHSLVCKDGAENRDIRNQILSALSLKDGGGAALIAGFLVTLFGVSPAIAAVVAVLIVRLIVQPAGVEICKSWEDALKNAGL
jgi:hypothetical protein